MKSVADKMRARTGLTDDGVGLVDRVFGGDAPLLAINPRTTFSERSEQSGFANLVRGTFGMFRNPTAHEARIRWTMSKEDAEDLLTIVSLIHRRPTAHICLRGCRTIWGRCGEQPDRAYQPAAIQLYALSLERGPNFDRFHIFASLPVGHAGRCWLHLIGRLAGRFRCVGSAPPCGRCLGSRGRSPTVRHARSSPRPSEHRDAGRGPPEPLPPRARPPPSADGYASGRGGFCPSSSC